MKWPTELTIIRHGESTYNILRDKKNQDKEYLEFVRLFKKDPRSNEVKQLALIIKDKFSLGVGDYETPLTDKGEKQALVTGTRLNKEILTPDVVLCSPYRRTIDTYFKCFKGGIVLEKCR